MKFKWDYLENDEDSILDQIKKNRHLPDDFLSQSDSEIPSFSLLKDIQKATKRIIKALRKNEKIMIYGHDDVDGITAVYILYDFLYRLGSNNHFSFIPNRNTDNHGIPAKLIRKLIRNDFNLLITVDGGITEIEAVNELNENNIDTIITDHHLVPSILPAAFAIVNPKQESCEYPDKMLAGVSVSFLLVQSIAQNLSVEYSKNYLLWVAVGTLADRVPLLNVNRKIILQVFRQWNEFNDETFRTLQSFFIDSTTSESKLRILKFITRLLANGRDSEGNHQALTLLNSNSVFKNELLQHLLQEMREYEIELDNISVFLESLEFPDNELHFIYFDSENRIGSKFLGFSASSLSSKLMLPVVLMSERDGLISAEARSTNGLCLVKAFDYCSASLLRYGGHSRAAGFTTSEDRLPLFRRMFAEYIQMQANLIKSEQKINIDAVINVEDLDNFFDFMQMDYDLLQPYGQANKHPRILLKNYLPMRDEKKIRFKNSNGLCPTDCYDIVFKCSEHEFQIIDHEKLNE